MRLTAENIEFIDNYLKNSEVIYYDIRMEMLDHVATAVEQKMEAENLDFYDAFKNYMVVNKKGLMQQNEKTKRFNFGFILPFLNYCLKPQNLLVFATCHLLFFLAIQQFTILFIARIFISVIFSGMLAWIFFNFIYFGFSQSKRFYAIEKNGVILFVAYYPFQFLLSGIITGDKDISTISGLIVTFFLSWFLVFVFYNRDEIRKIKNLKNQLQR
mgnify:FL=1